MRSALQGGKWRPGSGIGRNNDGHIDCSSLADNELETDRAWAQLAPSDNYEEAQR